MSEQTKEKIEQMQVIEQNMQQLLMQKQQFQTQLMELDSALSEIDKTTQAYKIVGNIMILKNKDELKKDLSEKKEMVDLRLKTIEKQENTLREKTKKIQAEVMEKMGGDKNE